MLISALRFLTFLLLAAEPSGHDWFGLRDLPVEDTRAGILADAFRDPGAAEQLEILAAKGDQEAHSRLVYLYTREGSYRQALRHMQVLASRGGANRSTIAGRDFLRVVGSAADQSVVERKAFSMRYQMRRGNPFLPVTVNRRTALYMADTNASFSLICESEARRLGMLIREVPGSASGLIGITGAEIPVQVATAAELTLGGLTLRNVTFLVLRDNQEPFLNLASNERGILGISVWNALETMRWTQSGTFEGGFAGVPSKPGSANICFDGTALVVQGKVRERNIRLILDTGSEATTLWQPFAAEFPAALQAAGRTSFTEINGIGDAREVESTTLPELPLRIAGFELLLRPVVVLREKTTPESEFHHGRLGFDLLHQARRVTLDLRAMLLTLD